MITLQKRDTVIGDLPDHRCRISGGLAANLDCSLVVITGGSRRAAGFLGSTIAGIRRLLEILPDSGTRLAPEPHFLSALERRSDFDSVFDWIDDPRVGITVDTGHFHMAREDWRGIIRDYSDRI